ncbi:MAG: stage V sporulation protein AD [Clostridia bacterium]|nr:stage V sporulation protein AD [Clostridia bacterium]
MAKRIGKHTFLTENKPSFIGYGSVVGKKEHLGPMGKEFDLYSDDMRFGEKTYEKAESKLQETALKVALKKAKLTSNDIDMVFAGDLLNQCIGSTFGLKNYNIPYVGVYGACSTMGLSLALASMLVDSGAIEIAAAVTSSHFCSAERQYRFPLEYGSQRTPTSQWTVTAGGASIIKKADNLPYINAVTIGKIKDLGVKDANNMGAAMAPAAYSTIKSFLLDTNTAPDDYDLIFTGDLGKTGSEIMYELFLRDGIDIRFHHSDCGLMMFNKEKQDVHSGGSGCGCSAAILNSYIMNRFRDNTFKNILFVPTGALLSPTSTLQSESIPSIAHLINIKI